MTISMYGNEEIFPTDTETKTGTVRALELEYYAPKSRTYFDKLILITGIPFFLLMLIFIGIFIFLLFAHKDKGIFRPFKRFMIRLGPINFRALSIENTYFYSPDSYDPESRKEYKGLIEIIKTNLGQHTVQEEKPHTNSQYSEADGTERRLNSKEMNPIEASNHPIYYNGRVSNVDGDAPPGKTEILEMNNYQDNLNI